jgi:tRNA(fMet)-specific endonuclease VapC
MTLLPIIAYTDRTALEHARIWAELAQVGRMTGYYDIIVAATAVEHRSKVATLNPKHFAGIKGLELADLK